MRITCPRLTLAILLTFALLSCFLTGPGPDDQVDCYLHVGRIIENHSSDTCFVLAVPDDHESYAKSEWVNDSAFTLPPESTATQTIRYFYQQLGVCWLCPTSFTVAVQVKKPDTLLTYNLVPDVDTTDSSCPAFPSGKTSLELADTFRIKD